MTSIFSTLAAAAVLMLASVQPAMAQSASRSAFQAPVLGTTIRGTATTVFRITPGGAVTRISGNAIRLSTASVRSPTITLQCGLDWYCGYRYLRVRITPVAGSGPASISRLRMGNLSGGRLYGSTPAEGTVLDFYVQPLGRSTATFELGMDVTLSSGAPSGEHNFGYMITVQQL